MKLVIRFIFSLLALGVISGCAKTTITDRQQLVTGQLPRPGNVWVYDFAASPADVPPESAFAGQPVNYPRPQTGEHIAEGRKLGAEIATELVKQIRGMGMPASNVVVGSNPQLNDIVIRGTIITFDKGSTAERAIIGFGEGSSSMKVAVEGFQVTPQGLRKLGSGTTDSTGSKGPGMALGLVTTLATHNPAGLIISGGMKLYGEESGKSKVGGRAESTAKEIADVLKKRFQDEGWI